MTLMTLDKSLVGEKLFIYRIYLPEIFKKRLLELGFLENTEITLVHKSPNQKNLAFLVRGTVIGLRLDDVKKITVYKEVNYN